MTDEELTQWVHNIVEARRVAINRREARLQAEAMIEQIGVIIGSSADLLVEHKLPPVLECPPIPDAPGRVWDIATAFWHEVVHRGIQLGRGQPMWITGIEEFSYDEVLCFVQHIWLAFWSVTGLDFTDPRQSAEIKSWLGQLSPRSSVREEADDVTGNEVDINRAAQERLQYYIRHGGPSRAAEDPGSIVTLRGRTGTMENLLNYVNDTRFTFPADRSYMMRGLLNYFNPPQGAD